MLRCSNIQPGSRPHACLRRTPHPASHPHPARGLPHRVRPRPHRARQPHRHTDAARSLARSHCADESRLRLRQAALHPISAMAAARAARQFRPVGVQRLAGLGPAYDRPRQYLHPRHPRCHPGLFARHRLRPGRGAAPRPLARQGVLRHLHHRSVAAALLVRHRAGDVLRRAARLAAGGRHGRRLAAALRPPAIPGAAGPHAVADPDGRHRPPGARHRAGNPRHGVRRRADRQGPDPLAGDPPHRQERRTAGARLDGLAIRLFARRFHPRRDRVQLARRRKSARTSQSSAATSPCFRQPSWCSPASSSCSTWWSISPRRRSIRASAADPACRTPPSIPSGENCKPAPMHRSRRRPAIGNRCASGWPAIPSPSQ